MCVRVRECACVYVNRCVTKNGQTRARNKRRQDERQRNGESGYACARQCAYHERLRQSRPQQDTHTHTQRERERRTHTKTHARTHAHTHTETHAHTHTHIHTHTHPPVAHPDHGPLPDVQRDVAHDLVHSQTVKPFAVVLRGVREKGALCCVLVCVNRLHVWRVTVRS